MEKVLFCFLFLKFSLEGMNVHFSQGVHSFLGFSEDSVIPEMLGMVALYKMFSDTTFNVMEIQ